MATATEKKGKSAGTEKLHLENYLEVPHLSQPQNSRAAPVLCNTHYYSTVISNITVLSDLGLVGVTL